MNAIIHIDGDAFFASCEVAQNEALRGKPVVTGQEKGMAIAVSYEAKARGVSRGMLLSDIRKLVPDVIVLPGNYDLYKIMSRRMYEIMHRYVPVVEEYSVDECFGDVSNVSDSWEELIEIAKK
jgi:nucleotidyltransferase/DNA polymerase involved in DNA repair